MHNNDLYAQFKQHGLVLSQGTQIHLPPIQPPKPSLLSSLTSYIVPQQNNFADQQYNLIIVPILNNCFIIGRCNTLMCYKYQVLPQNNYQPTISRPHITHLNVKIDRIHICDAKYLTDRGEIAFVVQAQNQLTLYYVDLKENKIVEGSSTTYNKIESVRFICQKELVVVSSNNSKYYVHHCFVQSGRIKERNKLNLQFDKDMNKTQTLQKIDISGNIDQEQQSTICIFYLSILQDDKERKKRLQQQMFAVEQNSQIFRLKQFVRDLDGNLTAKNTYKVLTTKDRNLLPQNYEIHSYDNFYCIIGSQQIIVIKKKFDRYLFIDNIMEKVGGNSLKLHSKGIVTSQNGPSMELNVVQFSDPKCQNRMLDSIQIVPQLAQGFLLLWPYKVDKDSSVIFVFKKQKKLVFCNLIKMNPIDKMLLVVENTPKDKIPMIQEIAMNLGINKKDFYISQWLHSKRQLTQIHQFLLPCGDIATIKKQLRSTLRKKKLQVSKFLEILEKLSKIIQSQIQQTLSQRMLSEYIKNDFLLRKIKLKNADWRIDFRELDKIYNSSLIDMFVEIVKSDLYPQNKKQDPLHAMVEAPIKQRMQLKHVFQVFRIPILQNYTKFLIKFVSQFTGDQIVKVFQKYYELLPIYEFNPDLIMIKPEYQTEVQLKQKLKQKLRQKPNIQQQQFSNLTSVQFWRQMSKQRLQKQLHDFYPTSKITQAINTLCTSDLGTKLKLHKHGLITCTMQEYCDKLKDISGIKLYLKLCEQVNQYNLNEYDQSYDLSKQLIQIFRQNNNLKGKAYQTVRLYSSLHRFMLQHSFFQKKRMSTDELVQLTPQDLVALFFLENKQRKQFIFEQFRDIFIDLYKGSTQFNEVINKFICSQNCSRIELQIFIHQIRSKPKQFQDQNQQLIQIIIDGFCKKLQLREQNDTQRFIDIMLQMPLIKKLNLKIRKMLSIRECLNVFVLFNCEKQSYYNILSYEENNQIFRILLERYFNGEMKANYIRIDEDEVILEYCRNMLTVLFYLQEYVYYNVSEYQLLLTYCEVLIQWKQYQVIYGVIHEEGILQQFKIETVPFISDLVTVCLTKIYTDQEIEFTEQTKYHIRKILQIYGPGKYQVRTRELAKLQLAQIFEQWGTNVHAHDIHLVVTQWQQGKRQVFIKDLVNSYITNLSFETFVFLYKHLQMASKNKSYTQLESQTSDEFIGYCLYYAQQLLLEKNYDQITKILAFVKGESDTPVSYALISETFLKCLTKKYSHQQAIQNGKQALQYFTQYFDDSQQVKNIFQTSLQAAQFEYMSNQKTQRIEVDPLFCFKRQYVQVTTQMLWQVSFNLYNQREKNIQLLYYSYYFLLMIFRHPEHGFKNHKISYSLQALTELMFKLQAKIDESTQLWHINVYSLFKKFLRSLYLEGLTRIKQINPELFHSQFTLRADQSHLEMIKGRLKEDRDRNLQLLKCISKLQAFIAQYKAVRKLQRQSKLQRSVLDEEKQKSQKQRQQRIRAQLQRQQSENLHDDNHDEQKITISLKKFNYLRSNISFQSSMSVLITQKQIAEQIYLLEKEQKKKSDKKIPHQQGDFFKKLNDNEKNPQLQARTSLQYKAPNQGTSFNFLQALQQGLQQKFQPNMQQANIPPGMQQMMLYQQYPQHQIPMNMPINPFNFAPQQQPFYNLEPFQQLLNAIFEDIRTEQWDKLRNQYRREDLTIAAQRLYYSGEFNFGDVIKIMAKIGVIDERKLSVCLSSNMYLDNHQYIAITDDELKRLFPFTYLITPSTQFQYEFTQRMFRVMLEGFFPLIEAKATFFIIQFANYLGHVLGDETYTGHFLVQVLIPLLRGNLQPEIMARISLILNHLVEFPHQVKYHVQQIKLAFSANPSNQRSLEQYYHQFIAILDSLDRNQSQNMSSNQPVNITGYQQETSN